MQQTHFQLLMHIKEKMLFTFFVGGFPLILRYLLFIYSLKISIQTVRETMHVMHCAGTIYDCKHT